MSRLKDLYNDTIVENLTKKFGYKNVMQVPKLDKIVVNMGVGEAKENAKLLEAAVKDMETITGQKAILTKAKNSVANFKIREGMPIGCKVTLRGEKMYEIADRLINRGVLTKEELVSHIDSLPDLADQAARCETVWPGEPEPEEDDSEDASEEQ